MLIARAFRIERPPWMARRDPRCNDPALFFPAQGRSAEAAKAVCADCPVVQQCADYALADHGLEGVWGGMTAGERDRIRQQRVAS